MSRDLAAELVGRVVVGNYPAANYEGIPLRMEERRVRVVEVRDMAAKPLDPLTLAMNPRLRRGRYLIAGFDLEKRADRHFYFEQFTNVKILDPTEAEDLRFVIHAVEVVTPEKREIAFADMSAGVANYFADGFNRTAVPDSVAIVHSITAAIPFSTAHRQSA